MVMVKTCLQCNTIFEKQYGRSKRDFLKRAKFCSSNCHNLFRQGKPSTSPQTTFKKGHKIFVPSESRKRGIENNMWKGGSITLTCKICRSEFRVDRYRKNTARTCSRVCYRELRKSAKFRLGLSEIQKKIFKEKTGGFYSYLTSLDKLIRKSVQYRFWREAIFKRDNYICQICKKGGGVLRADHIKQFGLILIENNIKTFEEAISCFELWYVPNGRTLCDECHKKTPTYGQKLLLVNHQPNI